VILCGLMTSTALNMLVVPALYLKLGRPAPPPGGEILDLTGVATVGAGHSS
jgi:hypothetical protein